MLSSSRRGHLASLGLSHQTVRLYLSAIRHMQIVNGMSDLALASYAQLNYALRGLRRVGGDCRCRAHLPITPDILMNIYRQLSHVEQTYGHIMLWVAFCLSFFGFMHSGEFTCPSWRDFTVDMLSPQVVSVDSHTSPSHVTIVPFAVGAKLHLGRTGLQLCQVLAFLCYLAIQPSQHGPLFLFKDGSTLSRPRLVMSLHKALSDAGVDPSGYNGHSFRIGVATTQPEWKSMTHLYRLWVVEVFGICALHKDSMAAASASIITAGRLVLILRKGWDWNFGLCCIT